MITPFAHRYEVCVDMNGYYVRDALFCAEKDIIITTDTGFPLIYWEEQAQIKCREMNLKYDDEVKYMNEICLYITGNYSLIGI